MPGAPRSSDQARVGEKKGQKGPGWAGLGYFHNASSPCSAMACPVTLSSNRSRPLGFASRRCPAMRSILA